MELVEHLLASSPASFLARWPAKNWRSLPYSYLQKRLQRHNYPLTASIAIQSLISKLTWVYSKEEEEEEFYSRKKKSFTQGRRRRRGPTMRISEGNGQRLFFLSLFYLDLLLTNNYFADICKICVAISRSSLFWLLRVVPFASFDFDAVVSSPLGNCWPPSLYLFLPHRLCLRSFVFGQRKLRGGYSVKTVFAEARLCSFVTHHTMTYSSATQYCPQTVWFLTPYVVD